MKSIVLGAGMVGAPMAIDLAKDSEFDVTVADYSPQALSKFAGDSSVKTVECDLSRPANLTALIEDFDLVINAVPGFMGYQTLESIIEAGKNVVDIAFFSEDPFQLDHLAKDKGVTAIVDCGVSPGMSNVLIGRVDQTLDSLETILIYVGGLPKVREWPYEYKAPFSPVDVIEEYVRPARFVEHGQLVIRPALSEPEYIDFPGVGTLEVFNTDGLRSLATTMHAPNMKEKTMRYPGHIEKMRMLRDSGFFSEEAIEINGVGIRPLDLTAKLLFPQWEYAEGEEDITVLQIIVEGEESGQRIRYTYDLFDSYDAPTRTTSMARTTGYTATMALRLLANGMYTEKGIITPEFIGKRAECVEYMLNGLNDRGVVYKETVAELSAKD